MKVKLSESNEAKHKRENKNNIKLAWMLLFENPIETTFASKSWNKCIK